jgi:hypothetical protein
MVGPKRSVTGEEKRVYGFQFKLVLCVCVCSCSHYNHLPTHVWRRTMVGTAGKDAGGASQPACVCTRGEPGGWGGAGAVGVVGAEGAKGAEGTSPGVLVIIGKAWARKQGSPRAPLPPSLPPLPLTLTKASWKGGVPLTTHPYPPAHPPVWQKR